MLVHVQVVLNQAIAMRYSCKMKIIRLSVSSKKKKVLLKTVLIKVCAHLWNHQIEQLLLMLLFYLIITHYMLFVNVMY